MRLIPALFLSLFLTLMSCEEKYDTYIGLHDPQNNAPTLSGPLGEFRQRHQDTQLKILAIGNSFTENATDFLPGLVKRINQDEVCIARLVRSGCSLNMHWKSHVLNTPDYKFYYSGAGEWNNIINVTIDDALASLEWDIIVIQQLSGESGEYSTYQPALDFLVALFYESNPDSKLAWHYTWAYVGGANHKDFHRYDNNPFKMYEAILNAGDRASAAMDIRIPSTQLIWRMREEYTEVADGFSEDGIHVTDKNARYALSCLWYETLVRPYMGTTCINQTVYPNGVDGEFLHKAIDIINDLTDQES